MALLCHFPLYACGQGGVVVRVQRKLAEPRPAPGGLLPPDEGLSPKMFLAMGVWLLPLELRRSRLPRPGGRRGRCRTTRRLLVHSRRRFMDGPRRGAAGRHRRRGRLRRHTQRPRAGELRLAGRAPAVPWPASRRLERAARSGPAPEMAAEGPWPPPCSAWPPSGSARPSGSPALPRRRRAQPRRW